LSGLIDPAAADPPGGFKPLRAGINPFSEVQGSGVLGSEVLDFGFWISDFGLNDESFF
jgi:hypothetical protein